MAYKKNKIPLHTLPMESKVDFIVEMAEENHERIKNINGWVNWFGFLSVAGVVLWLISAVL